MSNAPQHWILPGDLPIFPKDVNFDIMRNWPTCGERASTGAAGTLLSLRSQRKAMSSSAHPSPPWCQTRHFPSSYRHRGRHVEVVSNLRPPNFLAQCSTQRQSTRKFRRTLSQITRTTKKVVRSKAHRCNRYMSQAGEELNMVKEILQASPHMTSASVRGGRSVPGSMIGWR